MKKIFTLMIAAIMLIGMSINAEAANFFEEKVGIVIIGSSDYKTKDFIEYAQDFFKAKDSKIEAGKKIQTKYQNYWLDKGMIEEGTPTKEDFINFVDYSGCKKVIYLVIKDSVTDQHNRKKGKSRARTSLTINAFLTDRNKIIKATSATNEEDSKTSELRAKRGAFKQCVKELSDEINPLLK